MARTPPIPLPIQCCCFSSKSQVPSGDDASSLKESSSYDTGHNYSIACWKFCCIIAYPEMTIAYLSSIQGTMFSILEPNWHNRHRGSQVYCAIKHAWAWVTVHRTLKAILDEVIIVWGAMTSVPPSKIEHRGTWQYGLFLARSQPTKRHGHALAKLEVGWFCRSPYRFSIFWLLRLWYRSLSPLRTKQRDVRKEFVSQEAKESWWGHTRLLGSFVWSIACLRQVWRSLDLDSFSNCRLVIWLLRLALLLIGSNRSRFTLIFLEKSLVIMTSCRVTELVRSFS